MARKQANVKRLWIMLALLVILLGVFLWLPSGSGTTAEAEPAETEAEDEYAATTLVHAGDQAPDFTVEMFDGSRLTLSAQRGKVVLLNFWATWCPPCREELTHVQSELIDRFAGRPFLFLPVSRGEERETVAAFREKTGYTFAMGLDPEQTIYNLYASNYIPRNFLIDKEGRVVLATVGYEPEEFDALVGRIDALLGE